MSQGGYWTLVMESLLKCIEVHCIMGYTMYRTFLSFAIVGIPEIDLTNQMNNVWWYWSNGEILMEQQMSPIAFFPAVRPLLVSEPFGGISSGNSTFFLCKPPFFIAAER